MIIQYATDLSKQVFNAPAGILQDAGILAGGDGAQFDRSHPIPLGEIDDPVLVLDIPRLSGLENGNLIQAIFQADDVPIISMYGNTKNEWHKLPNTWPVSIDSLIHLYGQRRSDNIGQDARVLDLFSGTGVAGTDAMMSKGVTSVDFSDVTPECVASSVMNSQKFGIEGGKHKYFVGDVFEGIPDGERYDVILASAPPATPVYDKLQRPINPLFEGTCALETLLKDAPKHLQKNGKLILSHSALGERRFQEAAKTYGANVDQVLFEKEVPFRIEFLGSEDWVNYLVEEEGMIERPEEAHPYWHTVQVKEVSYS